MAQRTTTKLTGTFRGTLCGRDVTIDEYTDFIEIDLLNGPPKVAQGHKKYRLRGTGAHVNRDDAGFYLPTGERIESR